MNTTFVVVTCWTFVGIMLSWIKWPGLDQSWFSQMADQAHYGDTMEAGMYLMAGLFFWPILGIFYLLLLLGKIVEAFVKLIDLWKQ